MCASAEPSSPIYFMRMKWPLSKQILINVRRLNMNVGYYFQQMWYSKVIHVDNSNWIAIHEVGLSEHHARTTYINYTILPFFTRSLRQHFVDAWFICISNSCWFSVVCFLLHMRNSHCTQMRQRFKRSRYNLNIVRWKRLSNFNFDFSITIVLGVEDEETPKEHYCRLFLNQGRFAQCHANRI